MTIYAIAALVVAVVLQIVDVATTLVVLDQGGKEVGLAAFLVELGWPRWAWMGLPKVVLVAFAAFAYLRYGDLALLVVLGTISLATLYAVIHNAKLINQIGD